MPLYRPCPSGPRIVTRWLVNSDLGPFEEDICKTGAPNVYGAMMLKGDTPNP